jgi:hypothetical protein
MNFVSCNFISPVEPWLGLQLECRLNVILAAFLGLFWLGVLFLLNGSQLFMLLALFICVFVLPLLG